MFLLDFFRKGASRLLSIKQDDELTALACTGCKHTPVVTRLSESEVMVVCVQPDCPDPVIMGEYFETANMAIDKWNELVNPPEVKQREQFKKSGSRAQFR